MSDGDVGPEAISLDSFTYNQQFMNRVDQVISGNLNLYICVFKKYTKESRYQPRPNSFTGVFKGDGKKKEMEMKTQERSINFSLNSNSEKYYVEKINLDVFNGLSDSKDTDNGETANTLYGKTFDSVINKYKDNLSANDNYLCGCIIFHINIEGADELLKDITSIQMISRVSRNDLYYMNRVETDSRYKRRKAQEDAEKKKIQEKNEAIQKFNALKAEQELALKQKEIDQTKGQLDDISEQIHSSVGPDIDLRCCVFSPEDIGDISKDSTGNLKQILKKPVEYSDEPHNLLRLQDEDLQNQDLSTISEGMNYKIGLTNDDKRLADSNDTNVPEGFSWLKMVNASKRIFVIRLKIIVDKSIEDQRTQNNQYIIICLLI